MKGVILAAGMGTRLGTLIPKPLTALQDEKSILHFQVERLAEAIGIDNIMLVVGYKHHLVMEAFPDLMYVYNQDYTQTSTAKSLLCALRKWRDDDVIWMNGDVFFDSPVLQPVLACGSSGCLVDDKKCGDEEVKYRLDANGYIAELSKSIEASVAVGEALGVNVVRRTEMPRFVEALEHVDKKDYFEKALEVLVSTGQIALAPISVGDYFCQEIDFREDLDRVRTYIRTAGAARPLRV